ncbi:MAG: hypothetical protein PCFJNLEI_01198 [Verrucomicrobiae bacterium]|nr:hypothetical protein [Verrucomicrobiae bacterium]
MSTAKRQAREAATRAKERRNSILLLVVLVVIFGLGLALHYYFFHRKGASHPHRFPHRQRIPWGLSETETDKAGTNQPNKETSP